MTLGTRGREALERSLEALRERAEALGGPPEVEGAFFDADDYPEFDEDPAANYHTGIVQGLADALGVTVLALLEQGDRPIR